MMLDTEIAWYNTHRHKLHDEYRDKFIVIVNRKIVGVYNSHAEAYTDTCLEHEVGRFLICNMASAHRL